MPGQNKIMPLIFEIIGVSQNGIHILTKLFNMQIWRHLFSQIWWFWAHRGPAWTWVSVASLCCHNVWWRGLLDRLEDQHTRQSKQVDRKQRYCCPENQHSTFWPSGLPSIKAATGWGEKLLSTCTHCQNAVVWFRFREPAEATVCYVI